MQNAVVVDVEFLNSLMKVKSLSESEFAQTIGVSHSTVNRVLNGKRGAGSKFIIGVLNTFPEVSFGQLISHAPSLPKGNTKKHKASVHQTEGVNA